MLFSLSHSPFSSFHTQYECRMHTTPNKCKIIFVIAIYGVMSMLIGVLDRERCYESYLILQNETNLFRSVV